MRLNQITSTLLLTAGMLALAVPMSANAASPTSNAGASRAISTSTLQRFNVGGGAAVYTNTPGSVAYFGWSTGSSSGSVSTLSSSSTATVGQ